MAELHDLWEMMSNGDITREEYDDAANKIVSRILTGVGA